MDFQIFKQVTQSFNVLKQSDVEGSYCFSTATVSFESLKRRHIDEFIQACDLSVARKSLSLQQYQAIAKVMPLATHEYTHFVDSTSTVWGMRLLYKINKAYSCDDKRQQDETQFWHAKKFYDFLREIALPKYYTTKYRIKATRPWGAKVTAGQLFDKDGKVTDRAVLFQRFYNAENELLVRSPISNISILEASAMAQETKSRVSLVAALAEDSRFVEQAEVSNKLMDYLYNPDLTEYSVCVHLVANALGTPDINSAFAVCAILTRVCLNLTDELFDALAVDKTLMCRVDLPSEHNFSHRIRNGLRLRDLGTAFFLMSRCLPKKPDLMYDESESIAIRAVENLGISPSLIHANAIAFGEGIAQELSNSQIEPICWLYEAGLKNLRQINPLSLHLDFSQLHLPLALLGDSTERFVLGDPQSPLAQKSISSIYKPLIDGELWVERFAEGCF